MKLTRQTKNDFLKLFFLSATLGTLIWAMIEILLRNAGFSDIPTLPEISLDVYFIKISIRLNPGTFIGIGVGTFVFFKI
ncbi:hypothetical protein WKV44_06460 [Spirochaetia bacterium 38H-sp]|uniref:DUF4321 domain-containing protein n=1 Tax=Rarispira pelagica TaxID=3141764 RepID=A0ABU9UCF3_9SPIR